MEVAVSKQNMKGYKINRRNFIKASVAGAAVGALWLGDGEVDQVAQGARFKGDFESNWMFIIGSNLQYRF